jgi:hypothetical protein
VSRNGTRSSNKPRNLRYGTDHQRMRRQVAREVALGLHSCARCGEPVLPGDAWHLDHADDGMSYIGASHAKCNIRAANEQRAEDARRWRELSAEATPRMIVREW